ncbi:hypothetical protein [Nonlabens agnitus]|nr:hypothetical protein [Nonlabens agnitus]
MTTKDTIKIFVNLDMEWWMRHDELMITKNNDEIHLRTIIREDTTLLEPLEYGWRINNLGTITIRNENNEFEKHFALKSERIKAEFSKSLIYEIITSNDTLKYHTKSLGDKGREVNAYLKFMNSYYPNEKDFRPFEESQLNE